MLQEAVEKQGHDTSAYVYSVDSISNLHFTNWLLDRYVYSIGYLCINYMFYIFYYQILFYIYTGVLDDVAYGIS